MKEVKEWYKKQATTQIHYRKNEKISYLPIFSYRPMKPKTKRKVKKMTWKFKRGDKIRAERRFFRGIRELSNKVRIGKVNQTNSKFRGSIPAYNIKWNGEPTGLWYDKESIESDLISKN